MKNSMKNIKKCKICGDLLIRVKMLEEQIEDAEKVLKKFDESFSYFFEGNPSRADSCEQVMLDYYTKWATSI